MDTQVLASQQFLNKAYAGVAGYVAAPENGKTGWPTMFALTRALQIELGVSPRSDGFGPATTAAFTSQVGTLSSSSNKPRISWILQCALWCKGYNGGVVGDTWGSTVGASVASVRSDLGLSIAQTVDVKLMRSLLTMDAYVLLSGGTASIREGQRWLNGKYMNRQDFTVVPCDGLFTRSLQQAVMYAIQYELGMADGTANGNFGPGTQTGLKAQASFGPGATDGAKNFVRLCQIALAGNGYSVTINGVCSQQMINQITAFQEFMEISATGTVDFGTWAALLVSTGDPNRAVTGFDTSTPITPAFATARWNEGYRLAGRYLTVAGQAIAPGELETLFDHGLKLLPIFQNYNNGPDYFTYAIGYDHGQQAAIRARQLGFSEGIMIFFAVDYDATGDEASSIVLDYFDGVKAGLAISLYYNYRVGVYGTRNVCRIVQEAGRAEGIWVSAMSTGYSGNLGFPMPQNWMYSQIQELHSINIDKNQVSSRAQPVNSTQIRSVPRIDDNWNSLFRAVAKHQTLTEHIVYTKFSVEFQYINRISVACLLIGHYDDKSWQLYASFVGQIKNNPLYSNIYSAVRAVGTSPQDSEFEEGYDGGDVFHMFATLQGVLDWGQKRGVQAAVWATLGDGRLTS
ncbi:DUF1906 domain-containing protein [Leucobacter coleopterorum]|uniref:DUF1906 domain-containing protein n=1 Tax=Leucobacter coleopterorum TaxID=2714933 RepID=A0ABX6JYF6_9MICO|nr:glycoside hydrolase domain-containing protein [Leucobacter coleopterorum]QIM17974.1 DUF1906 domain-containing protein [Leucobacter coleopterorum]